MSDEKKDEQPAGPARALTAAAKKELNALVAKGVSFGDAMKQVSARADAFETAVVQPKGLVGRAPATSEAEVDAYFDVLTKRVAASRLVPPASAVPISEAHLSKLLAKARLPYAYVAFLKRFGGQRCRLWSHNHLAVEQPYLAKMQRSAFALGKRVNHPLPHGGFAILGHLGDHYEFVAATGGIDETVFIIDENHPELCGPRWSSVLGWVDSLLEEAEKAQRSGYFGTNPNGTQA